MSEHKDHHRHILFYYFKEGKNATQAWEKICAVYGGGALSKSTAYKWFAQFRSGNCAKLIKLIVTLIFAFFPIKIQNDCLGQIIRDGQSKGYW